MNNLNVLIIDDSAVYRKVLTDAFSKFPNVTVVGSAHNGKVGIDKIKLLKPDFITLDFNMPIMDGIATLKEIKQQKLPVKALMISSETSAGAKVTMEALELGAFDFIPKPNSPDYKENTKTIAKSLIGIIRTLGIRMALSTRVINRTKDSLSRKASILKTSPAKTSTKISANRNIITRPKVPPRIVALGISTGGPNALAQTIPKLPVNLKVPIVVVQHMPPMFTKALAESLDKKSQVRVVEGENGMDVEKGTVYIAPGGKMMKLVPKGIGSAIKITDAPPENNCKPAADYLFRSVAEIYKSACLGVIMTGMGGDGTKGLKAMKEHGIKVIGQTKETCVVYGMPMEAMKAGVVDIEKDLDDIPGEIVKSLF